MTSRPSADAVSPPREERSLPPRLILPTRALARSPGPEIDLALLGSAAARHLEAEAAAALPAHRLMQRAGAAVARLAMALAPHARRVCIVAGPGNNGGDGHEAGAQLLRAGQAVDLIAFGTPAHAPADARHAMRLSHAAGVPWHPPQALARLLSTLGPQDLVIDALLGRGLNRPADAACAAAIDAMNTQAAPVLAVDLPSGLPGDTGHLVPGAACVRARWTLALLSLAPGLFMADGRDAIGELWFDDLGVEDALARRPVHGAAVPPSDAGTDVVPLARLIGSAALAPLLLPRPQASHKGRFGDVWIVGGASSMGGAALLAARAAAAAGAGRVHVARLDEAGAGLDPTHPELMFTPLPEEPGAAARLWGAATVVAGCGGGDAIRAVLPRLLSTAARLVLDADALNAIAGDEALRGLLRSRAGRGRSTLMTPHPLEAARLLGRSAAAVQADRIGAARELADSTGCTVVLKGSGSVIAAPGGLPCVNPSGNAALATPGTGDVLAGWLGGAWSAMAAGAPDGETPHAAQAEALLVARACVYLHGAAAQAAHPGGQALGAAALVEAMRRWLLGRQMGLGGA